MFFEKKKDYKDKKSLIIYFSRADENYEVGYIEKGNTEVIAEYIKEFTGADIFKVEPLVDYPKDYDGCLEESKVRSTTHNAPIKSKVPDITDYEVIYIGSPVYWGGIPEELFTALEGLEYRDKIIRPFVTHEGSGLASIPSQLKGICKGAYVKDGLAIKGSDVQNSKDKVKSWI